MQEHFIIVRTLAVWKMMWFSHRFQVCDKDTVWEIVYNVDADAGNR